MNKKTLISELGFLLKNVENCVCLVVHCYMTVNVNKWCVQRRFEYMGNTKIFIFVTILARESYQKYYSENMKHWNIDDRKI